MYFLQQLALGCIFSLCALLCPACKNQFLQRCQRRPGLHKVEIDSTPSPFSMAVGLTCLRLEPAEPIKCIFLLTTLAGMI